MIKEMKSYIGGIFKKSPKEDKEQLAIPLSLKDRMKCSEKVINGRRVLVDNNGNFKGFCKDKK
jgi:hypothetical protein